jgi:hypothetical protein
MHCGYFTSSSGAAKEKDVRCGWYVFSRQVWCCCGWLTNYCMADANVRTVRAPRNGHNSISNLLELLDAHVRPGVTEDEFKTLFVKCECQLILTHRAHKRHVCNSTKEN